MRGLKRTDLQIRNEAVAMVREILDAPPTMEEFIDDLVQEGLVEYLERDGTRYYAAVDGPSLYRVVQDKILGDLL